MTVKTVLEKLKRLEDKRLVDVGRSESKSGNIEEVSEKEQLIDDLLLEKED